MNKRYYIVIRECGFNPNVIGCFKTKEDAENFAKMNIYSYKKELSDVGAYNFDIYESALMMSYSGLIPQNSKTYTFWHIKELEIAE